jgi:hypothetical protein
MESAKENLEQSVSMHGWQGQGGKRTSVNVVSALVGVDDLQAVRKEVWRGRRTKERAEKLTRQDMRKRGGGLRRRGVFAE